MMDRNVDPVAWGMKNAVGEIIDVITPAEHAREEGQYTIALYTHSDHSDHSDRMPVAWRTFDGEGGYDYRTYEDNERYAAEWAERNPRHVDWVEPLYLDARVAQSIEQDNLLELSGRVNRLLVEEALQREQRLESLEAEIECEESRFTELSDAFTSLATQNTELNARLTQWDPVMRQALAALERVQPQVSGAIPQQDVIYAIAALREALEGKTP